MSMSPSHTFYDEFNSPTAQNTKFNADAPPNENLNLNFLVSSSSSSPRPHPFKVVEKQKEFNPKIIHHQNQSPIHSIHSSADLSSNSSSNVTIFGYPTNKEGQFIDVFSKLGPIISCVSIPGNNWMSIRYSTYSSAQKALSMNGKIINGCMIGVIPTDINEVVDKRFCTVKNNNNNYNNNQDNIVGGKISFAGFPLNQDESIGKIAIERGMNKQIQPYSTSNDKSIFTRIFDLIFG